MRNKFWCMSRMQSQVHQNTKVKYYFKPINNGQSRVFCKRIMGYVGSDLSLYGWPVPRQYFQFPRKFSKLFFFK